MKKNMGTVILIATIILISSCTTFKTNVSLDKLSFTMSNTFQKTETSEEMPFGKPLEFDGESEPFEFGPYIISVNKNTIKMEWGSNENWDKFERVLEPGFYDRYYIEFENVNIISAIAEGDAPIMPGIMLQGANKMIIEIGEGNELKDGNFLLINMTYTEK